MQNDVQTQTQQSVQPLHTEQTTCCIVGAGPAGAVLALLLARQGIPVVLLEEHMNFDRDFRGDTIHPSVLQIMDQLGLADRLLTIPHAEMHSMSLDASDGPFTLADFRRLKTRFPFIAMLPQAHFLEFITTEAKRYPNFRLIMGARVEKLLEEDGYIHGVRYSAQDGWHELRATLTVGADGRFSRVRKLVGFEPIKTAQAMDVLWFRLPRKANDPTEPAGRIGSGHILIMLNRDQDWQMGYVIPKGGYQKLRAAGLPALRQEMGQLLPAWVEPERIETIQEWKQVSILSVESSRLPRWYRPGLLLIGDAAHVMSPVGGVGINYAIQDAVVAANVLTEPLKVGKIRLSDLAKVQRKRELPIRIIQGFQNFMQQRVIANVLGSASASVSVSSSDEPLKVSPLMRFFIKLPVIGTLPARLIAFGPVPVHLKQ